MNPSNLRVKGEIQLIRQWDEKLNPGKVNDPD